jgi:hypothetical protein
VTCAAPVAGQARVAPAERVLHGLPLALTAMPGIGLDDLVDRAALQTRLDRKYLVTVPVLHAMLAETAGSTAALDIDGRRIFDYSSVYFDTADLLCFREHRQGRRRRFKVRTRCYLNSGDCLLEVKAVGPRDQTIKRRMDYRTQDAARLSPAGRAFAADILAQHPAVPALRPTVRTDYRRVTLLDRRTDSRVTVDVDLRFLGAGSSVAAPASTVVVETKSAGAPGVADLALRRLGVRPVSVSQYCLGVALLHPVLPANRWHRVLRRHFAAPTG